ncbi:MAG: glucose 1-dehydrogenase [Spirochaetaceae bacterium]|nr:glucose 1-dehydrogenase [Spirochaetaceae bacterium]
MQDASLTLEGKSFVVTGGALGIGGAISDAAAAAGARVLVVDRDAGAGAARVDRITAAGGTAVFLQADLATHAGCRAAVAQAVAAFGTVDVLCNNVGIQPPASYQTAEDTTEEMWDQIMAVNVKSYFLTAKYAIPHMRSRGGGAIINIASVQGLQSAPLVPAYAASKGAALSLTRQMAIDYARENIRVLAVCPGSIDTPLLRAAVAMEGGDLEQSVHDVGLGHPLGRTGQPEEIASVVVFLAGSGASFMTGEYVCVDGGYNALGAWAQPRDPGAATAGAAAADAATAGDA